MPYIILVWDQMLCIDCKIVLVCTLCRLICKRRKCANEPEM